MHTIARATLGRSLACLVIAAGAAGCGSASPSGSATSTSQGPGAAAFAFSHCMRTHGVSGFPDPKVSVTPGSTSVIMHVTSAVAHSPHLKSAQQTCGHLLPGPQNRTPAEQHARAQALLAFARCLRSHGIPNFPDPDSQGQLSAQTINAAGVDLHAPGFLTAAKACVGVTHGAITGADVARAINGPH
jgi:hypothetical protein